MSKCCGKKECTHCKDMNLGSLIYSIKCRLSSLNTGISSYLKYGYTCSENDMNEAETLTEILPQIEQEHRNQKRGSSSCLSCSELRKWLEPIQSMVGVVKSQQTTLKIDRSGLEQWNLQNPQCCELKRYKIYAKNLCKELGITCTIESKVCSLALEITKDILNCDVQLVISAYKKACRFGLEIKMDRSKCEVELGLLKEKTNCDLTLSEYYDLVNDTNLCYDIIKTVYANGLSLETDGDDPILVTPLNSYNLRKDIDGEFKPSDSKLTIKKILDNYK